MGSSANNGQIMDLPYLPNGQTAVLDLLPCSTCFSGLISRSQAFPKY